MWIKRFIKRRADGKCHGETEVLPRAVDFNVEEFALGTNKKRPGAAPGWSLLPLRLSTPENDAPDRRV